MGSKTDDWEFAGTSKLNASGATGTGTATIPKDAAEQFYDEEGKADLVVFTNGEQIRLVPRDQVELPGGS